MAAKIPSWTPGTSHGLPHFLAISWNLCSNGLHTHYSPLLITCSSAGAAVRVGLPILYEVPPYKLTSPPYSFEDKVSLFARLACRLLKQNSSQVTGGEPRHAHCKQFLRDRQTCFTLYAVADGLFLPSGIVHCIPYELFA
jgi:hypothetical protein